MRFWWQLLMPWSTAHAKRWQNGWELHIEGPGGYQEVTQSHGLRSAERMARDYIALDLEIPEDSFEVEVVPEVGGFLGDLIRDAKTAIRIASERASDAAEKSRKAVAKLHEDGMTQAEIAQVLKISQQRVSQLLGASGSQGSRGALRASGRKRVDHERSLS
jgi:predicted XRE-type DNA-binding protein